MKKLLALLLATLMVFSVATLLAGCGDDSSNNKASQNDDDDKKDDKKDPTDPAGPTDPEPTNPEPTEGNGLLNDFSPKFKEENYPNIAIIGVLNNGTEDIEVQYGYQSLSDTELLLYMTNPDGEWMYRVKVNGDTAEYTRYLIVDGQWYEDETTSATDKETEFNLLQTYLRPFVQVGYGYKYKQIGTENHDLGTVNVFEIYDGEELSGTVKVHATYGLIVEAKDVSGKVSCSLSFISEELDLEDFLMNGYPDSDPPENDVNPDKGDEFESDIDVTDPIDPDEGGIVGGGDFDINFG